MKSTYSTQVILSSVGLLTVLAIVGYYFLFQSIQDRAIHTSEMQNQIEEAVGRESYLLSLKNVLADNKKELALLSGRVVAKDGTGAFLDKLESLGRLAGVTISTDTLGVGASGEGTDGFIEQIGLGISVTGSYSSVRHFLSLLETVPYSITMPSVSLEQDGGKAGKGLWRGVFKITALIYK